MSNVVRHFGVFACSLIFTVGSYAQSANLTRACSHYLRASMMNAK